MENTMKLKEQKNTVQIIGELKSFKFNWGKKDKNGREFVNGNMIVQTTNKHGVGEHRINIFQYKTSKEGKELTFYKALKTIEQKYSTIDRDGEGTLVKIMASVENNEYYNKNKDEMATGISLKPYKVTSKEEEVKGQTQGVIASVGGYLDRIVKNPEDGKVTCRLTTVNFFGNIIPIDCEVREDLTEVFLDKFEEDSTVTSFKLEIIRAAKTAEKDTEPSADDFDGFGDCEEIEDDVVYDYINTNMIIGGKPGFNPQINLDPEAMAEAFKQRELALQQRLEEERAKKVEDDFSNESDGFGDESNSAIDDDELPF